MLINKKIVLDIEKKTKCPILEMFWTKDDDRWYVCFEEDIVIEGKNQIVHLDDVLEEIKKYDNVECIVNEVYSADKPNSYYEQVTFQWKEPEEKIHNQCKECFYHQTSANIFDFHDESHYCHIYQKECSSLNKNDIRFCDKFKHEKGILYQINDIL